MRQILLIALLLLIVDALPLRQKREGKLEEEGTGKRPSNPRGDNNQAPVGKTASLGSRREEGEKNPVQEKKPEYQGKGTGLLGPTGSTHIDGKLPKSQPDAGAANSEGKNPQSVEEGAKDNKKKLKSDKVAKEPPEKNPNPGGDEDKPKAKTSRSDVDSSAETKRLKPKGDEAGPSLKAPNNGEEKPVKPDKPKASENKGGDEDDKDDQGVQNPKSGAVTPPKGDEKELDWNDGDYEEEIESKPAEKAFGQVSVKTIGKVGRPSEESSSSSFVTYFIIAAVIVIVIYLVFHNKKKLMAYVIEGRNTGRVRRGRGASGAEYKPLNNPEESMGCRTESA